MSATSRKPSSADLAILQAEASKVTSTLAFVSSETTSLRILGVLETAYSFGVGAAEANGELGPRACVAVFVTDPKGRVLLGRRNKDPNRGKWVFPGGGIKTGESYLDAARRELREETGLEVTIDPESEPHVVENTGDKGTAPGFRGALILFLTGTASGEPVGADDLLEPTWFHFDALPEDLSPITREMVEAFLDVARSKGEDVLAVAAAADSDVAALLVEVDRAQLERVAAAMFSAFVDGAVKAGAGMGRAKLEWSTIEEDQREDFRRMARVVRDAMGGAS